MFKTKSFNLVNEEEAKKREKLYVPKKCRCMHFIVAPAIIGFMLLLILVNVDFTGHAYDAYKNATSTTATTIATTSTYVIETTVISQQESTSGQGLQAKKLLVDTLSCTDIAADCNITCSGGSVVGLSQAMMIYEHNDCMKAPIGLTLTDCTFPNGILTMQLFRALGNKVKTLNIIGTNLSTIESGAFSVASVKTATKLTLVDNSIQQLAVNTFTGLSALTCFQLLNYEQAVESFEATNFLQPMSATLSDLAITQFRPDTVFDPTSWLAVEGELTQLQRVNMYGNNFGAILRAETFSKLVQVRDLLLAYCAITALAGDTFSAIIATLEFLNLSGNHLTTLDANFVAQCLSLSVHVELAGNAWNCDCESVAIIEYVKYTNITFGQEPICTTPAAMKGLTIEIVAIKCEAETTPTTTIATTSPRPTPTPPSRPSIPTPTKPAIPSKTPNEPTDTSESYESEKSTTPTLSTPLPVASLSCSKQPISSFKPSIVSHYYIKQLTPTSVSLNLQPSSVELKSVYFKDQSSSRTIFFPEANNIIFNLHTSQSYVFCILNANSLYIVSPLDCRSHHLWVPSVVAPVWLYHDNAPLFISLSIFGVILTLILGGLLIYVALRWHPYLVSGNRRLKRLNQCSHEVFLLPKETDAKQYTNDQLLKFHTTASVNMPDDSQSHGCRKLPSLQAMKDSQNKSTNNATLDYMKFYNSLGSTKPPRVQHSADILPPSEYAPSIWSGEVKCQAVAASHLNTAPIERLDRYNHEYESVDIYEELY